MKLVIKHTVLSYFHKRFTITIKSNKQFFFYNKTFIIYSIKMSLISVIYESNKQYVH